MDFSYLENILGAYKNLLCEKAQENDSIRHFNDLIFSYVFKIDCEKNSLFKNLRPLQSKLLSLAELNKKYSEYKEFNEMPHIIDEMCDLLKQNRLEIMALEVVKFAIE